MASNGISLLGSLRDGMGKEKKRKRVISNLYGIVASDYWGSFAGNEKN